MVGVVGSSPIEPTNEIEAPGATLLPVPYKYQASSIK